MQNESQPILSHDLGCFQTNRFGDRYLYALNRESFDGTGADTVYRSHFGDKLFAEDTFYVIGGSDSGLLFNYVRKRGIPSGTRYLFVEPPEVLAALDIAGEEQTGDLGIGPLAEWKARAQEMGIDNYAYLGRIRLVKSLAIVDAAYPDYLPFWRSLKGEFDYLDWNAKTAFTFHFHTERQIENLTENQTPAMVLRDAFPGKTAVLLAGGPSLREHIPWVKAHRGEVVVIAVSRISRGLREFGLTPDIVVSIDPFPANLAVSCEMLEFAEDCLLVNGYHLNPALLSAWGGRKVYLGARYPWDSPREPDNFLQYGPTVTNAAYALATAMGINQVVLLGVDLCFDQSGYTHAAGSSEHSSGPKLMLGDQLVRTNSGLMAETKNEYMQAARTIESLAKRAGKLGCRTINPAPHAAVLEGVDHAPLETLPFEPLEQPARQTIAQRVPVPDRATLLTHYRQTQTEVDRVLRNLREIKILAGEALEYNARLCGTDGRPPDFHYKAKLDRAEEKLNSRHGEIAPFVKKFGMHRFITVIRAHEEKEWRDEDIEQAGERYYRAYLDTATELVAIMQRARERVLSRIEEESASPNLEKLSSQWKKDEQPGRAFYWEQTHREVADALDDSARHRLDELDSEFKKMVADLNNQIASTLKDMAGLQGVQGKATECLLRKDRHGLERLLNGLQHHADKEQSGYLINLARAYLYELDGDDTSAIAAYRAIDSGPARFDALKRLLVLSLQAQDHGTALETLARLAGITPVFIPSYADMLRITGDVDRAVELYTDYLTANPDDLHAMMKLGNIYRQLDFPEGVQWTMQYILARDPHNEAARRMLDEACAGGSPVSD